MNDDFSLMKSDRTGNYVILGAKAGKPPFFKMPERFVDAGSVDNFIAEQENKAILQKHNEMQNFCKPF